MRKQNKAFTLIELIVVLVILAIIALIVTPIILNILDKAEVSARKRSVDGYGKAAELALATYRMEKGYYPKAFDELSIEYSGSNIKCNEQIINKDGSIYLSKCYVDKVKVKDSKTEDGWYHYGELINDYNVGDEIVYNGVKFYVIKPSTVLDSYVTVLKDNALTYDEVVNYGSGHVNMYNFRSNDTSADSYYRVPNNVNDYGYMAYYTSETCGYNSSDNYVRTGCTTDYSKSEIKYVVDNWAKSVMGFENLDKDKYGYEARLITYDDLTDNLGYEKVNSSTIDPSSNGTTPDFVYNSNYGYWTMSVSDDNNRYLYTVMTNGGIYRYATVENTNYHSGVNAYAVRPVINLKKDVLGG